MHKKMLGYISAVFLLVYVLSAQSFTISNRSVMLGLPVYNIIYYDTVTNSICVCDTSNYIISIDSINGIYFNKYSIARTTILDFGKIDTKDYIPVIPGFKIKIRTIGNIICNNTDTICVSDSIIEIKVEGKDICNQVNDIVVKVGSGS